MYAEFWLAEILSSSPIHRPKMEWVARIHCTPADQRRSSKRMNSFSIEKNEEGEKKLTLINHKSQVILN